MADDRVLFTIEAENQQLKAKLAETQAELNNLKTTAASASADMAKGMDATAASTAKATSGFGELTKGIRSSISQVTGFISSLTAALGVATALYTIGKKIGESNIFGGGATQKFVDSLDLTDAKKSLEDTRKEITSLQNRQQEILSGGSLNLGAGSDQTELDSIERQLRTLNALQKNLAGQVFAPILRKRGAEGIIKQTAADAEQLRQKIERDLANAAEQRDEESLSEERFARIVKEVGAEYDIRAEAEDKLQSQRKKAEDDLHAKRMQLMEAEARHFAEAYEKAIDQINRANATFFNNFADKQNGLLLSIRQEITRIRGSIPSSGGAAGFGSGGSY